MSKNRTDLTNRGAASGSVTRRTFLRSTALAAGGLIAAPAIMRHAALGSDDPILIGSCYLSGGGLLAGNILLPLF